MRRGHFELFRPVCPCCLTARGAVAPLVIGQVLHEEAGHIIEGVLHCADPGCFLEYPIIDAIPFLVPDLRRFLSDHLFQVSMREDLSATVEGLLGDCCGPGSAFDATRAQLSSYAWGHYADLDPLEQPDGVPGGSILDCLAQGLALLPAPPAGPVLDLGCAVGRTSFALAAATGGPVLGVDLNVAMLRLAQRVLRHGAVRYPRRRIGIIYDRRDFPVDLPGAAAVDFWACDALALPFEPHRFGLAAALNVLDCVASPRDLLQGLSRVLTPGGDLILSTPYDWSPAATPLECWIGGHSQRGPTRGDPEPFLRTLLTPGAHPLAVPGLSLVGECESVPWQVRLHARSRVHYRSHLVALRASGAQDPAPQGGGPAASERAC